MPRDIDPSEGLPPASVALSAVASAASPLTTEIHESSTPLRLPLGTSLKPSGVTVRVYFSPFKSSSRLNSFCSLVVMCRRPRVIPENSSPASYGRCLFLRRRRRRARVVRVEEARRSVSARELGGGRPAGLRTIRVLSVKAGD